MLPRKLLSVVCWAAVALGQTSPSPNTFVVSNTGGNISSAFQYGIMFEDINHAIDGGLYAELIMNRAFQFANSSTTSLFPYYPIGGDRGASISLDTSNPLSSALPYSLKVTPGSTPGSYGFANPGYYSFEVKPQVYSGSFYVRGSYSGTMTAALISAFNVNEVYANLQIPVVSYANNWTQISYQLTPPAPAPSVNNSLAITFDAATATDGSLNFNLISLFPPTYNSRPNGNRIDLMNTLAGLNPSFLRWGGNNIEGNAPSGDAPRWIWNNTIGPLKDRPGRQGVWGYVNTDGLGLDEVFEWAQDLDMAVILTIWDGHYLDGFSVSEADLQPYIDDALNELEYILGDASTTWGAARIANGYPDPRKLFYVEIGNEDNLSNGSSTYSAYRFNAFANAIHAAYPDLIIMPSTTAVNNYDTPAGDIADFHIYTTPDYIASHFGLFDQQTSDNRTFVGEYAVVQPNGIPGADPFNANFNYSLLPTPIWEGSVAEAVFLLGLERNSGNVWGASYAPSFESLAVPNISWSTDLVQFTSNTSQTNPSTSYHVVSLLSGTRFTTSRPVSTSEQIGPLYWVAGENTPVSQKIWKGAVYNATGDVPVTVQFEGLASGVKANLTILTGTSPTAGNVVNGPDVVSANTTIMESDGQGGYTFSLPNLSVAVLSTFPSNSPDSTYATELLKSGFGGYTGCSLGRGIVEGWGNGC